MTVRLVRRRVQRRRRITVDFSKTFRSPRTRRCYPGFAELRGEQVSFEADMEEGLLYRPDGDPYGRSD